MQFIYFFLSCLFPFCFLGTFLLSVEVRNFSPGENFAPPAKGQNYGVVCVCGGEFQLLNMYYKIQKFKYAAMEISLLRGELLPEFITVSVKAIPFASFFWYTAPFLGTASLN